ncbi:hypothetical protein LIER_34360 [Lithospermum erythrorhizon]|uniref:Uncharacterized protein n=1 Tax=Lithospermum erythrorhizon TaxID=34254 RepID=A0AAV3S0Q8_LITER
MVADFGKLMVSLLLAWHHHFLKINHHPKSATTRSSGTTTSPKSATTKSSGTTTSPRSATAVAPPLSSLYEFWEETSIFYDDPIPPPAPKQVAAQEFKKAKFVVKKSYQYNNTSGSRDLQMRLLADILSVLALTMSAEGERVRLI